MVGAGTVHDATAYGETRSLTIHHTHSGEDITVTFKRNGRYDEDGLKKLNWFLRDWRSQEPTTMDRHLFDIVWEVYRDVDARQPVQIISAYRSPATNAMLRRRSSGVARFSQHMQGNAMDFFIPGVSLDQIRAAGLRLQRGGVGFYPTSGSPFVHLDTGRIRHWPRMSHDQLARVFPNGRTVHVPSDGNPLPGYALAMADIEKRRTARDTDGFGSRARPGMLASLLGGKSNDDEDETASVAAPATKTAARAESRVAEPKAAEPKKADIKAPDTRTAEPAPLPRSRPAATYQVAAAPPQSARAPEPRPQTPADIINARGFWGDDAPKPTAAQAQALAFAAPTLTERSRIVAASAPVPRLRPPSPASLTQPVLNRDAGEQAAKVVAISASQDPWLRALIAAPSAHDALAVTAFGEPDLTTLASLMVKPRSALAVGFCADPHQGVITSQFTGSATAQLSTVSFITRTAALR
ncbi:MAG: DUF882 domain-containing protein [Xanthobacteraceae bacterium]|nr:MAG: DUF882 domain-containing protein [Xanthobacteraceae bacterium]